MLFKPLFLGSGEGETKARERETFGIETIETEDAKNSFADAMTARQHLSI